ncbi:MAG: hypothetical protein ACFE0P_15995 [Oceanicaulis sp.]
MKIALYALFAVFAVMVAAWVFAWVQTSSPNADLSAVLALTGFALAGAAFWLNHRENNAS